MLILLSNILERIEKRKKEDNIMDGKILNDVAVSCDNCKGKAGNLDCETCHCLGRKILDRTYAIGKTEEGNISFDIQPGQ